MSLAYNSSPSQLCDSITSEAMGEVSTDLVAAHCREDVVMLWAGKVEGHAPHCIPTFRDNVPAVVA